MARYVLVEENILEKGTAVFIDKVEALINRGYQPIGGPLVYEGLIGPGHRYRRMVQALYSDTEIAPETETPAAKSAIPQPEDSQGLPVPAETTDNAVTEIPAPPVTLATAHTGKGKKK